MWTMPPALMRNAGDAGIDFGELVLELLFEDGAGSPTAVNTGTLGGSANVGGATPATISTADAFQGTGSLHGVDLLNPQGFAAFGVGNPELRIGTANFKIQVAVKLESLTTTFDQVLWSWQSGSPYPMLGIEKSTGVLYYADGTTPTNTSQTVSLNVWNEYELNRLAGVTTVLYNGVSVLSFADTSNYNVGFAGGSLLIGAASNGAAAIRGGFIDQFRFYNGNA